MLDLRAHLLTAVHKHFDVSQRLSARSCDYVWFEKNIWAKRMTRLIAFSVRLRHHRVSTGNASCAGSRAGNHHASRLRMRTGHDTGCWCLRGKNHQAPSPQVYSLDRRRLRRVALLLRQSNTACNVLQRCGPFPVRY